MWFSQRQIGFFFKILFSEIQWLYNTQEVDSEESWEDIKVEEAPKLLTEVFNQRTASHKKTLRWTVKC